MKRCVGTRSMGIRCPIIKEGDNLEEIITNSLLEASKEEGFKICDKDVLCITESIVARAQGNYCTIDNIANDISSKFGKDSTIGLIFPILSRNRFSILLRGIARGVKKIVLMLSYPNDEVGNPLLTYDQIDDKKINPYLDVLTLPMYRKYFGKNPHLFTGVDYVSFYQDIIEKEGCKVQIIFSNNPKTILKYTKDVLVCDIHTRQRTKAILKVSGANKVYGLDNIMSRSMHGSGFNKDYGLLGSNKATENRVKLFPRDAQNLVEKIQEKILNKTKKQIEVMVYGDGAFKDPKGKIWELADPVVSPFFTSGLKGTPNELKLKFLADNEFKDLKGDQLKKAIEQKIKDKDKNLKGKMISEGTTPRQLTDLIGSLADLTSGSGDKGTPIVYIQGYFDNYSK